MQIWRISKFISIPENNMKKNIYFILSMIAMIVISVFSSGNPVYGQNVEPETIEEEGSMEANDSISMIKEIPTRPNRSVTPVDVDDAKPPVVMHYYDKHGEPLAEPVMFIASLDTVMKPKSKPVYPLYNGVSMGVNIADAILMAAGQSYGSFDVWADVSLHNWFFPVLEAGLGFASSTPENGNFSYKSKPSFYTKIGINYNFLYKSNSDYQCFLGLRAAYSNFSYNVNDVSIGSDYWGEQQTLNIKGLNGHAFYGEVLAGIKVKIVDRFSLGWSLRYHFKFKTISNSLSNPWFIPGYGANSPISFSLSAIYTIGNKPKIEDPLSKIR